MRYRLVVKKPIELVGTLLGMSYGQTHLSLEGDLSHLDLRGIPDVTQPAQGRVILPVTPTTKDITRQSILPRIGLRSSIYHVLLERDGKLVFAAYDQFDQDCVWISSEVVDEARLQSFVDKGMIRSYTRIEE